MTTSSVTTSTDDVYFSHRQSTNRTCLIFTGHIATAMLPPPRENSSPAANPARPFTPICQRRCIKKTVCFGMKHTVFNIYRSELFVVFMVLAISAVTTVIAITAITAWAAVAITAGTVTVTTGSTFAARSALRLYPTLGLGKKGTH